MNGKVFFLIILFFFLAPFSATDATVVINEVSPVSDPEWIELYSTDSSSISLDGCKLQMGSERQSVSFGSSDVLTDQARFKVVKKGIYPGWSSNWLNNSGDTITLSCSSINDSVAYGNASGAIIGVPASSQTIGRSPDGTGNFMILATATEGTGNVTPTPTSSPTPTLAPTPTDSPAPTNTPTSTNSPTPTKTPTPTPTATKTPTPSPTRRPSPSSTPSDAPTPHASSTGEVLSLSDAENSVPATPSGTLKPLIISFALVGAGCGILALYVLWQKRDLIRVLHQPKSDQS